MLACSNNASRVGQGGSKLRQGNGASPEIMLNVWVISGHDSVMERLNELSKTLSILITNFFDLSFCHLDRFAS
jgi:hypothetical protein